MKGYFARLAQQTGVPIRSRTDSDSTGQVALHPNLIGDEIAPIHVEETRQIEPQEVQAPDASHEASQVDDDISEPNAPARLEETRLIQAAAPPRPETETASPSIESEGEARRVVPQAEEFHERLQTIQRSTEEAPATAQPEAKRDVRYAQSMLERDDPKAAISELRREKDTENILFDSEPVSSPEREVREPIPSRQPVEVRESVEGFFEAESDTGESTAFQPDQVPSRTMSEQPASRERIWHDTLKAVREWVAETPVEIEEIQPGDTSEIERVDQDRPEVLGQMEFPADSKPMKSQQGRGELVARPTDIQDLHLTIGTIHLTVESPQKEVQPHQPPQIREDRQPRRESQSTRLSRYYLR